MIRVFLLLVFAAFPTLLLCQEITLASTTSTQNSGLLDAILPAFEEKSGIKVKVVAVGTGQAIRLAQNGDADVLLVHHRKSEDAFVQQGYGIERRDVMYNDFVIVGPADSPLEFSGLAETREVFAKIHKNQALFISRGDDSGTHKKEQEIWEVAGIKPHGDWYREIGSGMGAALNMAAATDAFVMTDRGTWITFGNKANLRILFSGDPTLFNPYGLILVNPKYHPHINIDAARNLALWMVSAEGQHLIAEYMINGVQAFCPNANNEAESEDVDRTVCPVEAY